MLRWNEADYGDGMHIRDLCKIPILATLCDGSLDRLENLIQILLYTIDAPGFEYNKQYQTFSISTDSEESSEETENEENPRN